MNRVVDHTSLPGIVLWILNLFCSDEHYEEFRGDLEEMHELRQKSSSNLAASFLIWFDALSMLRVRFRSKRSSPTTFFPIGMLRNYFYVALRSLKRHAAFSSLNIVGLSVSMAVGLILILFVRQSAHQDEFHEHADRLVRVYSDFKSSINRNNAPYGTSPANLSDLMEQEVPGIERAAEIRSRFRGTLVYQGTGLPLNGLYADSDFFELFSFELASGDPTTALLNPGSLVLSPSEVVKFFGTEDPMGKVMSVVGSRDFTVTGVLASDRYDTLFPLDAIASYSTLEAIPGTQDMLDTWTRSIYGSYTFALLEEGASLDAVQHSVSALIPVHFAENNGNRLHGLTVQPMVDISLGVAMGNELGVVLPGVLAWFFAVLAFMILATACFNYVGLTVSRSLKRSREVGIRKVFGAAKAHITAQFIFETVMVSAFSVVVAVLILQWLEPAFNSLSFVSLTGVALSIDYLTDGGLYLVLAVFSLVIALIAGVYPALFLSRFQPAEAVRGASDKSGKSGSRLRKTLVVVQFSLSLIFLVVTVTMMRQANYMQNADYGFRNADIVNVRLFDVPYERFRDRISSSANVELISGARIIPASGSRSDTWVSTRGTAPDDRIKGYRWPIDENFVDNLELELVAGRKLTSEMGFNDTGLVLVNETLLRVLNLGSPIEAVGTSFITGDSTEVYIAGVLKDAHIDDIAMAIAPYIFILDMNQLRWANVRLVPGRMEAGIEDIRAAWLAMGHARSVDYEVFETQLKESMSNLIMRDAYRLIGFISLLTIIIACLGLLGIASFNVERRTKEISIRKVLGADVAPVLRLLSSEFVLLISIAAVISIPVAWMLSNLFLQNFEYRVSLGMGTVFLGLGAMALIALVSIGSQTLKAALTNPIENLHDD